MYPRYTIQQPSVRAGRGLIAVTRTRRVLESGALQYRMGRPLRYWLIVQPAPRIEGELPQLVGVLPAHD